MDHEVCYHCRALETVQRKKSDEDAELEKGHVKTYPGSRYWYAIEHKETEPWDDGEDSQGPLPG